MNEHTDDHSSPDELWRWLLGGLVGGGIILGLLIAAYAIGYHRGRHAAGTAIPAVPAPAPMTTRARTTATTSSAVGPVVVTSALVARGKSLYSADGCSACHSITGTPGAGPSFKGIAGSRIILINGQTITADDAYLEQSIANPDAKIVKGYRAGVMPAAIASYNLTGKPNDIRALVAFIEAQK
jgi:mono/diheme cytochrome c family protein